MKLQVLQGTYFVLMPVFPYFHIWQSNVPGHYLGNKYALFSILLTKNILLLNINIQKDAIERGKCRRDMRGRLCFQTYWRKNKGRLLWY